MTIKQLEIKYFLISSHSHTKYIICILYLYRLNMFREHVTIYMIYIVTHCLIILTLNKNFIFYLRRNSLTKNGNEYIVTIARLPKFCVCASTKVVV